MLLNDFFSEMVVNYLTPQARSLLKKTNLVHKLSSCTSARSPQSTSFQSGLLNSIALDRTKF